MDVTEWPDYWFLWVEVTAIYGGKEAEYTYEIQHYPRFREEKCPGKLIGLHHNGGEAAEDKWRAKHPKWHEQYRAIRFHNFYADRNLGITEQVSGLLLPDEEMDW